MQSLDDDEQKQVLGEVLADELRAISEYVKDVPRIGQELHQAHATINEISDRLTIIEHVARDHEAEIRQLKQGIA